MSKCLKCGGPLPLAGACPHCARATPAPGPLLSRELNLDRRSPVREAPAAPPPVPPGLAPRWANTLARPPSQAELLGEPLPAARGAPPAAEEAPQALTADFLEQLARSVAEEPLPAGVREVRAQPASLWRRLVSFAVDAVVVAAVAGAYLWLAALVAGRQAPAHGLSGLDGLLQSLRLFEGLLVPGAVLTLVLALTYCAVASFLWDGRTLGRRLAGLQLVDQSGLPPGTARSLVRALLSGLSFALGLFGFWVALFDRRGQTLHDKLTSTFVVRPS